MRTGTSPGQALINQSMNAAFFIIILLAVTVASFSAPAYGANGSLAVVYTGKLEGELEPCGCTAASDMGGIRRLASVVDGFRQQYPDLVLVGSGGLIGTLLPAHRTSNAYLLAGLQHLNYDALGVHWEDLIYGAGSTQKSALPRVVSNWRTEEFKRHRAFHRGNLSIAYLQWLAPEVSPYRLLPDSQRKTSANIMELQRQLEHFREHSFITIVGTDSMDTAFERLPLKLIDILLLPANQEQYAEPEKIGNTWVLRPGSRGQYVALLALQQNSSGQWNNRMHTVVPLDESVPDSPRLEKWYKQYTKSLALDFRQREEKALESQEQGVFAGVQACAICHEDQLAQWHSTEHARALSSLRKVNKHHDANCLVCHTVGFGQSGGYPYAQNNVKLEDVGCEACHGPAKAHALAGGVVALKEVTEEVCTSCHNVAHSPEFSAQSYWPRVLH